MVNQSFITFHYFWQPCFYGVLHAVFNRSVNTTSSPSFLLANTISMTISYSTTLSHSDSRRVARAIATKRPRSAFGKKWPRPAMFLYTHIISLEDFFFPFPNPLLPKPSLSSICFFSSICCVCTHNQGWNQMKPMSENQITKFVMVESKFSVNQTRLRRWGKFHQVQNLLCTNYVTSICSCKSRISLFYLF